ncbi:surface lipoprotein assembly modifier [Neisseria lisongii]|uniref:Surface lipoprotein assembly modifier n=1 Tax=Neisseria lisongii TaxID=2912188 RepID=A0AAW5ALW6_9NEIS|nr:surface lipoprotein assembly modifier [Neisseria lisongii]MCF7530516.1 surface lipoprotein assembly modifier [Neisseria lisongii]
MRWLVLLAACGCAAAYAQTGAAEVGQPSADPVDVGRQYQSEQHWEQGRNLGQDMPPPVAAGSLPAAADKRLAPLEYSVNQALLNAHWDNLAVLLPAYRKLPQHDPILYAYAQGALLRHQKKLPQALALYADIVRQHPEWERPGVEYGVMLFENRQYREAERQFRAVLPQLEGDIRQVVERYLNHIAEAQTWQPQLSLNYEATDNVNNASSSTEIVGANGRRWKRSEDSLPQSATGFGYRAGVSREYNAAGNHYIGGQVSASGVHYWDNSRYNEQSFYGGADYRYRTAAASKGLRAFAAHNRLGGHGYSNQAGWRAEYYRHNDNRLQWSIDGGCVHKYYLEQSLAERYNGRLCDAEAGLTYRPVSAVRLTTGIHAGRDKVRDNSESSDRKGVYAAAAYAKSGLGGSVYFRYTDRRFDAPYFFKGYVRQDKEYRLNAAVWHRKVSAYGWVPKLNYRHTEIRSNMPDLYARKSHAWFVTVEKMF